MSKTQPEQGRARKIEKKIYNWDTVSIIAEFDSIFEEATNRVIYITRANLLIIAFLFIGELVGLWTYTHAYARVSTYHDLHFKPECCVSENYF